MSGAKYLPLFNSAQTSTKVGILFGVGTIFVLFFGAILYWFANSIDTNISICRQDQYSRGDYDFKPDMFEGKLRDQDHSGDAGPSSKEVRILCWVMTYPKNHRTKAVHVKATWAKRFNHVLYMSSAEDEELPTIALPVGESRKNLWYKTKEAFKYIYNHYNGTYDWVLKADDDTYVIEENLRHLLSRYDPSEPLYFGCMLKKFAKQGYMQGGAGYILSRAAVEKFVVDGLEGGLCCDEESGVEDLGVGLCLGLLGVKSVDTRDNMNRGRFFPFPPEEHLYPGPPQPEYSWFAEYSAFPVKKGPNCCSDDTISFHSVKPAQMYVLDFLIYQLRLHGTDRNNLLADKDRSGFS